MTKSTRRARRSHRSAATPDPLHVRRTRRPRDRAGFRLRAAPTVTLMAVSGCTDTADVFPMNAAAQGLGPVQAWFVRTGTGRGPITFTMADGEVVAGEYRVAYSSFVGTVFSGAWSGSAIVMGDGPVQFCGEGKMTQCLCRRTSIPWAMATANVKPMREPCGRSVGSRPMMLSRKPKLGASNTEDLRLYSTDDLRHIYHQHVGDDSIRQWMHLACIGGLGPWQVSGIQHSVGWRSTRGENKSSPLRKTAADAGRFSIVRPAWAPSPELWPVQSGAAWPSHGCRRMCC